MSPSLSVCLTAKNSEACIVRAIDSVRTVADEIVLADTGSQDRTIALAQERGVRVEHFTWSDSLAESRNNAISLARCDWILLLDSDEWLIDTSGASLRKYLADASDILGCYISRRDMTDSARPDIYTEMLQMRLFRNHFGLRFRNRCHPIFYPAIDDVAAACRMRITICPTAIGHDGYVPRHREEKLRRAARLLAMDLADRPDDVYYLIEYGRTLYLLHDPGAGAVLQRAAKLVLAHRMDAQAPTPMAALLLECLIKNPALVAPVGSNMDELLALAQRWFPASAPLIWIRANLFFQTGHFASAAVLLEQLIRMGRDHSYDRHTSFDPRIIGDEARLNLAICLLQLDRLEEARNLLTGLLNNPAVAAHARAALGLDAKSEP